MNRERLSKAIRANVRPLTVPRAALAKLRKAFPLFPLPLDPLLSMRKRINPLNDGEK